MNEMIIIVNPKAGRLGKMNPSSKISSFFQKQSIPFQFIETKSQGHASALSREYYEKGYRDFICLGGDGTLYEMVNGFFQNRDQVDAVRLGVVPTGTGNSFLKDFSDSIDQTLQAILQKKTKSCDVVEVIHTKGKLYFVNIFSFGFTSDVGKLRNDYFSFAGHSGYILAVIFKVLSLRSSLYRLKFDDAEKMEVDSTFISINNTRFTGGNMMMAPQALPNDGKVDVIDVKKMGRIQLLQAFPKIFQGTHTRLPEVKSTQAHTIEFDFSREIPVMVDGELIEIQPLSLRVLAQGIHIYA